MHISLAVNAMSSIEQEDLSKPVSRPSVGDMTIYQAFSSSTILFGAQYGQAGGQNDDTKSQAWQQGWAQAQE
jgi:hypothetical protein